MGLNLSNINLNAKTSFFFLTNMIHLLFKTDDIYFYSWCILFITSIVGHQTRNYFILIIDKIMVYNVIFQGGMRYLNFFDYDYNDIIVLILFILVIVIYHIEMNYIKSYKTQISMHCIVHLLASIGHHFIINKLN